MQLTLGGVNEIVEAEKPEAVRGEAILDRLQRHMELVALLQRRLDEDGTDRAPVERFPRASEHGQLVALGVGLQDVDGRDPLLT